MSKWPKQNPSIQLKPKTVEFKAGQLTLTSVEIARQTGDVAVKSAPSESKDTKDSTANASPEKKADQTATAGQSSSSPSKDPKPVLTFSGSSLGCQPIFQVLKSCKRILIAGCGGGYDLVCMHYVWICFVWNYRADWTDPCHALCVDLFCSVFWPASLFFTDSRRNYTYWTKAWSIPGQFGKTLNVRISQSWFYLSPLCRPSQAPMCCITVLATSMEGRKMHLSVLKWLQIPTLRMARLGSWMEAIFLNSDVRLAFALCLNKLGFLLVFCCCCCELNVCKSFSFPFRLLSCSVYVVPYWTQARSAYLHTDTRWCQTSVRNLHGSG